MVGYYTEIMINCWDFTFYTWLERYNSGEKQNIHHNIKNNSHKISACSIDSKGLVVLKRGSQVDGRGQLLRFELR